jgi:histidinol-phosphatase (PHP family)
MEDISLPSDNHVHSEWSWDAKEGSMVESCRRAIDLGLPSIAFTEHVDLTAWVVPESSVAMFGPAAAHVGPDGRFRAPPIDVDGYFESVERCRWMYPDLRILSGLELGEPHWFPDLTGQLLASGPFDRVLGSLHSLEIDGCPRLVDEWFAADDVAGETEAAAVRSYLAESITMIESSGRFEVFAHIDYLTRQIVLSGRRHDAGAFEEEYRAVLVALAATGRVLEINTRLPLDPRIVRWWYEVGGPAVSFGSDAHQGSAVGHGFHDAAAVAERAGFSPQVDPLSFWCRQGSGRRTS